MVVDVNCRPLKLHMGPPRSVTTVNFSKEIIGKIKRNKKIPTIRNLKLKLTFASRCQHMYIHEHTCIHLFR